MTVLTPSSQYATLQTLGWVLSLYVVIAFGVFYGVKDAAAKYGSSAVTRILPSLAALGVCLVILVMARYGLLPHPLALVQKSALVGVCQGQLSWLDLWCWF